MGEMEMGKDKAGGLFETNESPHCASHVIFSPVLLKAQTSDSSAAVSIFTITIFSH